MRHLVDDDVLQAVGVLLGEFEVEPDVAGFAVARAPLGLHAADAPAGHLPADRLLPLGDEPRDPSAELLALPVLEDLAPTVRAAAFGDVEQESLAVALDVGAAGALDDLEA